MKLIVGLGNPEPEYERTRHNMGFDAVNLFCKKHEIELSRTKWDAIYGTGMIENEKVIILKPQTYMNLSGEAIIPFLNYYKIPVSDLLVIYDDMDIEKRNN